MKKKIIRILAGFFIVMMICTVIARAADSFTVAKVQTGHVRQGKLTVRYSGSGAVKMKDKLYQSLPEGQKIKSVLKKAGDQVHPGDPVVQLDLDYLQEKTDDQSLNLEKLRLQIEQQELEVRGNKRVPETALAEVSLEAAERTLNRAEESYNEALNAYNVHVAQTTQGMDESQVQAWQQETEKLDAELQSAIQTLESASDAYAQAVDSYNLAAKQEQSSAANEAIKEQSSRITLESLQADLEAADRKLQKLRTVQDNGGIVTSDGQGIFVSVGAQEGAFTTGSEQIILETGGLEASGILTEDMIGKVETGDTVQAALAGKSKAVELIIERIGQERSTGEEQSAVTAWYAPVEQTDIYSGSALTYTVTKSSAKEYEKLIPLSAIRTANNADYVLVARVKNGILGDSYTAVKVPVSVLDKDEDHAAVDPAVALGKDDRFIVSSNKYVEEGDRIRLSE